MMIREVQELGYEGFIFGSRVNVVLTRMDFGDYKFQIDLFRTGENLLSWYGILHNRAFVETPLLDKNFKRVWKKVIKAIRKWNKQYSDERLFDKMDRDLQVIIDTDDDL